MRGGAPSPGYALSSRGRWHFLYFFPLPHQQGAFRPSFGFPVVRGRWGPGAVRATVVVRPADPRGASRSHGSCATKRRRAASACANFCCCAAVKCPPKSSMAQRSSINTRLARVLLQITENRKVETRKPLIFQDTVFEFSLEKATLRQSSFPPWCN